MADLLEAKEPPQEAWPRTLGQARLGERGKQWQGSILPQDNQEKYAKIKRDWAATGRDPTVSSAKPHRKKGPFRRRRAVAQAFDAPGKAAAWNFPKRNEYTWKMHREIGTFLLAQDPLTPRKRFRT